MSTMEAEKSSSSDAALNNVEASKMMHRDPNARPEIFKSTVQEILFIAVATLGVAMGGILSGATIVILSFAAADVGASQSETTWITASSAGAFLLFFGKAADMFGRRSLLIGSFLLFAIFALAAGFSKTGLQLDILNAIMGIACAANIPPAQGLLSAAYPTPSKRKNYAFACFSAGNPLGFVFGTIFSGIATQLFNWRASFWLLAIIYLVVAIMSLFATPKDTAEKLPVTLESLKQFDIIGTILAVAGIALFSAALSLGPDAYDGWKTPYVLVCLILGVILMVVFVWWENKFKYPLMPMHIWRDRTFSLLMGITLLGMMAFPPVTFYLSLAYERINEFSALETAVHLLPMAVVGVMVNIFAGLFLHRLSNKLLVGIGASAYVIALLLLAVQYNGSSYWAFDFPALVIIVLGADLEFNVANMYTITCLPIEQQAVAGAIFQTVTKLAITVSLGIDTAIYSSVSQKPATSGYYAGDPFEPYAAVFWCSMALSVIAVVLVPFVKIGTQGNAVKEEDEGNVEQKAVN